ncbi:phosphatase PAP2 family protein [Saccharopolyspora elongata]|uniref:Phosphatase PAP2 family protein n=1 Tax=Saccharopolyspora elongata TaxID=2530387 RepID=A0A4R4YES8_9PSEU|nr:phosphatase PAP2 family protein [Saccharopolyspora elongata]TDD43193.1 phosphatase PAP2 family protein [Saccharopolyspora elongata]
MLEPSAEWYREIAEWGAASPGWVHGLALFGTQALLAVFAALTLLAWWRADRRPPVLLAPLLAAGAAWLFSDLIKDVVRQDRPCLAIPMPGGTIKDCAEVGVWSLPSSHSAAAAAFAVALSMLWRRITAIAVLLALLEGFSRIFIGVHYPHDVLAGFLLGAALGAVSVLACNNVRLRLQTS